MGKITIFSLSKDAIMHNRQRTVAVPVWITPQKEILVPDRKDRLL
jgi:hypothetical protein